jgi:spore coat polysaccharide biosynthesis protein SpsF (cytidylyltransferase family)
VTLALYEEPLKYNCRWLHPPTGFRHPKLRLTLDYQRDYELLQAVFERKVEPSAEQVIRMMVKEPSLTRINSDCRQRRPR